MKTQVPTTYLTADERQEIANRLKSFSTERDVPNEPPADVSQVSGYLRSAELKPPRSST